MIHHKAPSVFTWPENQSWDCMERIAPRLKIPTPSPWTNTEYVEIAETALDPLSSRPKDAVPAFNNWIWTWAYKDPEQETDIHRFPDKYPMNVFFTIVWMAGLMSASQKHKTPIEELFADEHKSDLIRFSVRRTEVIDPRVRKTLSHYGHIPIWYEVGDGTNQYPGTDTLWADKGNAMYSWMCMKKGFFQEYNLNAESHGDLMEVCSNLCYMHVVLGIDIPELFQFHNMDMSTWSLQWAMLHRDFHLMSMSGIADITVKHPNGPGCKRVTRLESICKYYSLLSKLQVSETIRTLEGQRTHEPWVNRCTYCGDPVSKTKHWTTIQKATTAIWTHLETCDHRTHCDGLGPGMTSDDIKPFEDYPVLIEARLSKEGLLSFDSILEESLVRCMESVMDQRVTFFETLAADWGPQCQHATTGCKIYSKEVGGLVPWVATFNIPLLESIASGHFFDRTFTPMNEDLERVRRDNARCLELLSQWTSQFPDDYSNVNMQILRKGEGLTQEFQKKPRTGNLGAGCFARHPDLHPTAYQQTDPNDIRLILPVRGALPMGCAKGVPGYWMIHPNLINAAVLQCYGLTAANLHFDAMSLAPNFDLLLTQQKATNVARLIAEWNIEEVELEGRGDLIVQPPLNPTVSNLKNYWDFIDPLYQSITQTVKMSEVEPIMSSTEEHMWLIPIMDSILQGQGTNLRAMCHHSLKCRQSASLKPKLNGITVQRTIETVIQDNLLHLLPDTELEEVGGSSQKLKTALASKTKPERDLFLWNYAGAYVQTGEWRKFNSREELWTILACFRGMNAPEVIPTCTTWSSLQDMGGPIIQRPFKQFLHYLETKRNSATTGEPEAGDTDPTTPQPPKKPQIDLETLLSMVDTTWKPDMHKGLDYLWTIMNESERESFLKGIKTVSTSTSMSTVVPMPPKSGQQAVKSSPPLPPPTQQPRTSDSSGSESQVREGGAIPESSSQTVPA